jgi:ABC-type branched-subunit amino acid transport system substrate-binding protein
LLISYADDGGAIVEELANNSFTGKIFGADGIAYVDFSNTVGTDPTIVEGIVATKALEASPHGDFSTECAGDSDCNSGIYTAETYDTIMLLGLSALEENGANMATHLNT